MLEAVEAESWGCCAEPGASLSALGRGPRSRLVRGAGLDCEFLERPEERLTVNSKRALFLGKTGGGNRVRVERGLAFTAHSPSFLFPQHHLASTSRASPQQHTHPAHPLHRRSQPPWCASNSATSSSTSSTPRPPPNRAPRSQTSCRSTPQRRMPSTPARWCASCATRSRTSTATTAAAWYRAV